MATKLPSVDVVLVGFGWTASILGHELAEAGLQVLALERGIYRDTVPDFATTHIQDELKYAVRNSMFEDPKRETLTFRNSMEQTALPMRHLGSFRPGSGVGGAGVHWNGQTWRFLPTDFKIRSETESRYGKNFIPAGMTIQDWGVTYEELEPYYDKFEYLCGVSGQAGNVQGEIQAGGNPFEGPRSRGYPLPPLLRSAGTVLFDKAARDVGFKPFACPAANTSAAYTNPLGVQMGPCTYCGYCEWFGCGNYSKASPQSTILPVLLKNKNFSYRTRCDVTKVNLDASGKRATGVTYVDGQGREFEQPAELVILCAFAQHNVHLHAALGDRQEVRPASQHRRGRPQLRLPDHLVGRRLRGRAHESVHGCRRARSGDRRIQRRQLRPRPRGLHRRRLHRPVDDRRPADPAEPRARGHAEVGRGLEEGDGARTT